MVTYHQMFKLFTDLFNYVVPNRVYFRPLNKGVVLPLAIVKKG